jgi:hypothetical protein
LRQSAPSQIDLGKSDTAPAPDFELPGLRVEKIRGARGSVCSVELAALVTKQDTIDALFLMDHGRTRVPQADDSLFDDFVSQGRPEFTLQQDGLRHSPPQILIDDADKPMKWYLQLKKAWLASSESATAFACSSRGFHYGSLCCSDAAMGLIVIMCR